MSKNFINDPWPILTAEGFIKTSHLLHMCVQMIGKLMLHQPFVSHWSHLAMPLTSRGISTGLIPFATGAFSVEIDLIDHIIYFNTSFGSSDKIQIESMSVAKLYQKIFAALKNIGVDLEINRKPQEVSNPINFDEDTDYYHYDKDTVNKWWRIMISTYNVLLKYHSRFYGITPSIGLFWGTLDLRDARYKGVHLPIIADYITRNSMDDAQIEVGFSCSNEKYPVPSFFAFAYPKPVDLEKAIMQPEEVKWISAINEFVLDYDDLRKMKDPENALLKFFETFYQTIATLDKWDDKLIVSGKPV